MQTMRHSWNLHLNLAGLAPKTAFAALPPYALLAGLNDPRLGAHDCLLIDREVPFSYE